MKLELSGHEVRFIVHALFSMWDMSSDEKDRQEADKIVEKVMTSLEAYKGYKGGKRK